MPLVIFPEGDEHPAAHELFVYEPLRVPFVHVLVSDTQDPVGDEDWYAVTLDPWLTVPKGATLQFAGIATQDDPFHEYPELQANVHFAPVFEAE